MKRQRSEFKFQDLKTAVSTNALPVFSVLVKERVKLLKCDKFLKSLSSNMISVLFGTHFFIHTPEY